MVNKVNASTGLGKATLASRAPSTKAFSIRYLALFVALTLLLGMIAIEPAEARRGGHRGIGGRVGGRSVMRGAGRMTRGLSRGLLGGRRGRGGRRHRNLNQNLNQNNLTGQNAAYPNGIDPNAANGFHNNGNHIGN
ncbi:MAG: hypothetical protein C0508_03195 [Cyanobacteria bacterium PR.023]|nr:hypothetical protein [Cyanobacteria bacterium PR.023]